MSATPSQVRAVPIFTTPVFTETWAGAEEWNAALLQAICDRRADGAGVSLSNVLGWQSDVEMLTWGDAAAKALRDHVVARCDAMTADLKSPVARRFTWTTEMWANVSPAGASNQTHCHPGSTWSVVYYVDDGQDESGTDAEGQLVFLDPRMPMIRMRTPDLRFVAASGKPDHQEVWIRPATGMLVYFPSWLMHSVRPYRGNRERISIAINIGALPLPPTPPS